MPEQSPAVESPTGTPIIPARFVPLALFATGALLAAAEAFEEGPMTSTRWLRLLVSVLTLALGASPGLRRHAPKALVLFAVGLGMQGCTASLHRDVRPGAIGKPGPVACYAAKQVQEQAWPAFRNYVEANLRAQVDYSCGAVSPSESPPAPLLPLAP
jgi:hypothetical protein